MKRFRSLTAVFAVTFTGSIAFAAAAQDIAIMPPGPIGATTGTGPYPARAIYDKSLQTDTLYFPVSLPQEPMPLLLWGNGGCRDNGLRYSQFLREVASHGFFVIASGHPRFEREVRPRGTPKDDSAPDPLSALPDTTVEQILAAIDWADQQNRDESSPYFRKIDTGRIGVMGTSCGGLQAIAALKDKRLKTGIAFNSGVLTEPPPGVMDRNANLYVKKEELAELQGPVAYINGGPSDIAYRNALDDFDRLTHVPVFFAENGVGHGGTYLFDEHGGEYAGVAIAWMSWQLKDDKKAGEWFVGSDCQLCTSEGWSVKKKGIDG
ncbi:hypothetical protein FV139_18535 [Parahaliea maris]|uniref:PET hydrolase/cutinase-like domain-containing protein n=1 Tax=Parahaliea maris TaxID=2716870 RepID=A0A5C8ZP14_9GAMM|nr:hypothetical protein [Parahaliea maris]TXS90256.1 hypothetical protein FV139_18535 [Parahaliea maris]